MSDHIERTIRHLIGAIRKMGVCNGSLDGRSRKSMDEVLEYLDKASCPDDANTVADDMTKDVSGEPLTADEISRLFTYCIAESRLLEREHPSGGARLFVPFRVTDPQIYQILAGGPLVLSPWQVKQARGWMAERDKTTESRHASFKFVDKERDARQELAKVKEEVAQLQRDAMQKALAQIEAQLPKEPVPHPDVWEVSIPGPGEPYHKHEADEHDVDSDGGLTLRLRGEIVARYPRGFWRSIGREKNRSLLQCGMRVKLEPGVKVRLDSGETARVVDPARVDIFLPDQDLEKLRPGKVVFTPGRPGSPDNRDQRSRRFTVVVGSDVEDAMGKAGELVPHGWLYSYGPFPVIEYAADERIRYQKEAKIKLSAYVMHKPADPDQNDPGRKAP